jgi:hypothetical protein
MPIIIEGQLVISTKKLRDHQGHHLTAMDGKPGRIALFCADDQVVVEEEPAPSTSLWCGCPDQAEHDQGVALQTQFRKQYRMTKSACVGCYLGDDGPSMHSCYVHPVKDWPEA